MPRDCAQFNQASEPTLKTGSGGAEPADGSAVLERRSLLTPSRVPCFEALAPLLVPLPSSGALRILVTRA